MSSQSASGLRGGLLRALANRFVLGKSLTESLSPNQLRRFKIGIKRTAITLVAARLSLEALAISLWIYRRTSGQGAAKTGRPIQLKTAQGGTKDNPLDGKSLANETRVRLDKLRGQLHAMNPNLSVSELSLTRSPGDSPEYTYTDSDLLEICGACASVGCLVSPKEISQRELSLCLRRLKLVHSAGPLSTASVSMNLDLGTPIGPWAAVLKSNIDLQEDCLIGTKGSIKSKLSGTPVHRPRHDEIDTSSVLEIINSVDTNGFAVVANAIDSKQLVCSVFGDAVTLEVEPVDKSVMRMKLADPSCTKLAFADGVHGISLRASRSETRVTEHFSTAFTSLVAHMARSAEMRKLERQKSEYEVTRSYSQKTGPLASKRTSPRPHVQSIELIGLDHCSGGTGYTFHREKSTVSDYTIIVPIRDDSHPQIGSSDQTTPIELYSGTLHTTCLSRVPPNAALIIPSSTAWKFLPNDSLNCKWFVAVRVGCSESTQPSRVLQTYFANVSSRVNGYLNLVTRSYSSAFG